MCSIGNVNLHIKILAKRWLCAFNINQTKEVIPAQNVHRLSIRIKNIYIHCSIYRHFGFKNSGCGSIWLGVEKCSILNLIFAQLQFHVSFFSRVNMKTKANMKTQCDRKGSFCMRDWRQDNKWQCNCNKWWLMYFFLRSCYNMNRAQKREPSMNWPWTEHKNINQPWTQHKNMKSISLFLRHYVTYRKSLFKPPVPIKPPYSNKPSCSPKFWNKPSVRISPPVIHLGLIWIILFFRWLYSSSV